MPQSLALNDAAVGFAEAQAARQRKVQEAPDPEALYQWKDPETDGMAAARGADVPPAARHAAQPLQAEVQVLGGGGGNGKPAPSSPFDWARHELSRTDSWPTPSASAPAPRAGGGGDPDALNWVRGATRSTCGEGGARCSSSSQCCSGSCSSGHCS